MSAGEPHKDVDYIHSQGFDAFKAVVPGITFVSYEGILQGEGKRREGARGGKRGREKTHQKRLFFNCKKELVKWCCKNVFMIGSS